MLPFETLVNQRTEASYSSFWKALLILLKSPHTVNRRLLYSSEISVYRLLDIDSLNVIKNLSCFDIKKNAFEEIKRDLEIYLHKIYSDIDNNNIQILKCMEEIDFDKCLYNEIVLRVAKLLPRDRNSFSETLEFALIHPAYKSVCFFYTKCLQCDNYLSLGLEYPYEINYNDGNININVENLNQWKNKGSLTWIKEQLIVKFIKWMENKEVKSNLVCGSLNLISAEKYLKLYHKLKEKYGKTMIDIWTETTDPQKFVFEDIAIATYLLTLWEEEREKYELNNLQTFVDLGCGNGLLVHILSSEGHSGYGIDLRRRKIWDLYPETSKLEVRTIIPSSKTLFPYADWIIGNHSDELTPWIPVITARSSYKCRYFLLPCCAYEFDGKKYQREKSNFSQYFEYMQFIQEISETCGFKTDLDKLRIPSTKRICLIGSERTYPIDSYDLIDLKIQRLINDRCPTRQENGQWTSDFKPREITEKVRNCTKVDRNLIYDIVNTVARLLLKQVKLISTESNIEESWNAGGVVELSEIAKIISSKNLKELKNEYGGLQTLFRNNAHIFKIESGKVRLRIPGKDEVGKKKSSRRNSKQRKIKPCWFYENHPDGCPINDSNCDFIH